MKVSGVPFAWPRKDTPPNISYTTFSYSSLRIRRKAKAYCSTVGTSYDGSSSELAARLIKSLLSGDQAGMEGWDRIRDARVEAYELINKENNLNYVS